MMFANRITPLTGCSIWLPETAPPACSPWQAPSQFQSCNTSVQGQAYGDPEVDEEDRLVDDRTVRRNLDLAIGDRVEYAYDSGTTGCTYWSWKTRWRRPVKQFIPCVWAVSAPPRLRTLAECPDTKSFWRPFSIHHEEHEHMKSWVGRPFDPDAFSVAEANERLRKKLRVAARRAD
jgi:hypothetical protein